LKSLKSNQPKVALIEVGGSHDECLLSQLVALKRRGCAIVLVVNKRIHERNPQFNEWVDEWIDVDFVGKAWKDFTLVRKMMKDIKNTGAKRVIFNTGQGGIVRNAVVLCLFSKLKFFGIIHTTRKFQGSTTQKVISWKMKRYLVLSQHLLQSVDPPKNVHLDYFYPLRFPSFPEKTKEVKELQITLIGGVESRRKDLSGFIGMIAKTENVHFTFLGKSDPTTDEVKTMNEQLAFHGLSERVTLFDAFVSHEKFDEVLQDSDAILPLIHPNTLSADQYFRNQIAGAMTASFSYKIPMLLHQGYAAIKEMETAAIYYEIDTFDQAIVTLGKEKESIKGAMSEHTSYQQEFQESRYADFILDSF
jgi:hypothetical protein